MNEAQLVGRGVEIERCRAFVAALRTGPATLAMVGEAGIGKSTLAAFTVDEARRVGLRISTATCEPAESGLAYSGLIDLLDGLVDRVTDRLSEPQRQALDVALLRRTGDDSPVEAHAVARASLSALQALAGETPTLLFVDDLQWLDPATRRVLAFVIRRLSESDRVGLLVTSRAEPTGLAADVGYRDELRLDGLPPHEVDELVRRSGATPSRAALRMVHDGCLGNPLYVLEMLRHVGAAAGSSAITLPPRLHELVRDRVTSLDDAVQEVLAVMSQTPRPTRPLIADVLTARQPREVDLAVDAAIDAGVVIEHQTGLRFAHPLFGLGISGTLGRGQLRVLHERLAELVPDGEQRARHLALARTRPDPVAAEAIASGARQARSRGAPELAAELAEAAVRLTPAAERETLRDRHIAAAYDHVTAGSLPSAADHFRVALGAEPPGWHRTDLLWRAAMLDFLRGDLVSCIEQLRAALAEAHDDEQRLYILRRLAGMHVWHGELGTAVAYAEKGLALAARTEVPGEQLALISHLVTARFMQAQPLDPGLLATSDALLARLPSLGVHEDPNIQLAPIRLLIDGPTATVDRLARVRDSAVELGDEVGIAWSAGRLAELETAAGRWRRAAAFATEALRAASRVGPGPALVWGHAALAVVAVHRGDFGEALAAASAVEERAQRQPILTFPAQARLVRAFAALSRGDGRTARAESLEARRQLDGIGIVEPGMPFLHWNHVDALLLAGDRSGAEEEVERLTEIAERTGYSFTRAIAARARGALLTLDGSVDAAVAQFDEALREHERSGWPFERARTLLAAGVALRRGKQKRLARERLQEAADVFAELGTAVWAERAAAELQRVGGRRASAPGALTASEQRVAELVVEGLTNDEVAGRLHLSTKTVAAHLTSVYAKLGVRSRTELARQLSSTG